MGEFHLLVVPEDAMFAPSAAKAEEAARMLKGFFDDAGVTLAYPVGSTLSEGRQFVDTGAASVSCPACAAETWLKQGGAGGTWWETLQVELYTAEDAGAVEVTMPCCGAALKVQALRFNEPTVLTRFYLEAPDVSGKEGLEPHELAALEALLGCSLQTRLYGST